MNPQMAADPSAASTAASQPRRWAEPAAPAFSRAGKSDASVIPYIIVVGTLPPAPSPTDAGPGTVLDPNAQGANSDGEWRFSTEHPQPRRTSASKLLRLGGIGGGVEHGGVIGEQRVI